MNILLISECDKRALTETRRILDQFAERRGERTWQTPITQDGLDTLRRLLKKTARKNTAVACHWIRGLDHSELLWIVGDASRFSSQGAVPTNTTTRNILRRQDENDWHSGEDIHLLTALAALLHDLGKASAAFQARLRGEMGRDRNQYRHEWVSLRLFEAFVGEDTDAVWLARLADPQPTDDAAWLGRLQRDGLDSPVTAPFVKLAHAPLAQAIGWLVVTHHRLPMLPSVETFQISWLDNILQRIDAHWNETPDSQDPEVIAPYWHFEHGLPVTTELWRKRARRLAQRLLKLCALRSTAEAPSDWLGNPYVMHVSRLCLMLADHHYSSLSAQIKDKDKRLRNPERVQGTPGYPLYANTEGGSGKSSRFNQTLDEHLLGVTQHSCEVTLALPRFEDHLARLARHKGLRKRSQDERFRWQDKAAEMASAMQKRSRQHGAFIVNMASTGCGKTLANARMMYALADPEQGMRCAFAMGLRTLTLQTGRAFRDLLNLGDDDLAIRVGGSASRTLFEHHEQQAEASGSASRQKLLDEDSHVVFEGNDDTHPLLRRVMHDPQVRAMLSAPVLVCTIDHLTPATESSRGGHQIAPMLRLMSSDLVLDEPDDFDISDLPALTRLVHWSGLLGARVLLSSATLPPALVQGLFEAYRHGRQHFERNRGEHAGARPPEICCAWVDEFTQTQVDCTNLNTFTVAHQGFTAKRQQRLASAEVRRRCTLAALDLSRLKRSDHATRFAQLAREAALALHSEHHSIDPQSGKRVSLGLIRMANIEPLVDVALALYQQGSPEGLRIHLCTYHSQFPLLIRSAIEQQLDQALNRRQPEAVFALPDIRQRIDAYQETDQLFIVLGSPVTEVGRDHDYDWAVVEPSSMRSLIQLAGRVRRHRSGACITPNLRVFESNLRHFHAPPQSPQQPPQQPAFCKPGFENQNSLLSSHTLTTLLAPHERDVINAIPRIQAPVKPEPKHRLVDLEHVRIEATMRHKKAGLWWSLPPKDALLTAVLPQTQPFRYDPVPKVDLTLSPSDDGTDYELVQWMQKKGGRHGEAMSMTVNYKNHRIPETQVEGPRISPWGITDYLQALTALGAEMDMPLTTCATKFGTVTLPDHTNGWRFHPALGFTKNK